MAERVDLRRSLQGLMGRTGASQPTTLISYEPAIDSAGCRFWTIHLKTFES
jgi:hypothetical protein